MRDRLNLVPVSRRELLTASAATLAATALGAGSACAADYPTRRVLVIVPFAAGGGADVFARLLAPSLEKTFGQPFIVDDRPGAAAIIGSQYVKTSAPDGYTLLVISNTHTVNETLYPNKPFKLVDDFVPVAPINASDLVLVTRPSLGAKTVADIVAMAKAKPGGLTFASSGSGTPYHTAGELFKHMAGVDILHVPYKGSSPARMDIINGQADMMFDGAPTMLGFIAGGQVKAIATTGMQRTSVLPDVPTVAETIPGYSALIWLGIVAPKGTPPEIVAALNASVSGIARQPEVIAAWKLQGAEPMVMDPATFKSFIVADIEKWAKIVQASGTAPQ